MTATYEPGTVAVATVRNIDGPVRWNDAISDGHITDIRPLVVLDLDSAYGCHAELRDPAKIVAALRETNSVAAHDIARQIEEQTKPPRIPEPTGRWAVVEATGHHGRFQAVRWNDVEKRPWLDASGAWLDWDDLADPALVRDGIQDGAA